MNQPPKNQTPERPLGRLAEAFMEADDAYRLQVLTRLVTPDARLELGIRTVRGPAELSDLIRDQLKDPDFVLRLRTRFGATRAPTRVTAVPGGWHFSWVLGAPPQLQRQSFRCVMSDDGMIAGITLVDSGPESLSLTRKMFVWAQTNVLAAVAILGGTTYIVVRVPLAIFYSQLGSSPDQVGLGTQDVVRQSALLLIGIVIVAAITAWLGQILIWPWVDAVFVARYLKQRGDSRSQLIIYGILASAYFGSLGVLFVGDLLASERVPLLLVSLFVGCCLIVGGPYLCRLVPNTAPARVAVSDRSRRRRLRWSSAPLLVLLYTFYFGAGGLTLAAIQTAHDVKSGQGLESPFLIWSAHPVVLHFKDSTPRWLNDSCRRLRYLGTTNGRVVIYAWPSREIFSLPSDDVSLTFPPDCG